MDATTDAFLASFSHTPRDEAWCEASHAAHALGAAKETTGVSPATVFVSGVARFAFVFFASAFFVELIRSPRRAQSTRYSSTWRGCNPFAFGAWPEAAASIGSGSPSALQPKTCRARPPRARCRTPH